MSQLRPVTDPSRMIVEYDVYEVDGAWRAIHKRDPALTYESADWQALFADCWAARIARSIRLTVTDESR